MSKRTILFFIPLSLSLMGLGGCGLVDEPSARNGGGYIVPPAPIAPAQPSVIDGYGNPAPELSQQPTSQMPMQSNDDEYNIAGMREIHAAASEEDCYKMMERFRKEGRNLELRIRSRRQGDLPYSCIFEGPDAQLDYFRDRRYEKESNLEGDG
jgi:hypothetical protein